jgi:peptidoglycan hydrolase CwlO-like protein
MGFLDKIKQQATDVASTVVEKTQETAKTGQMQMQLRSLKNEEKDALADLGAAMMALGETPASLSDQADRVRQIRLRIAEKETEIAEVREADAEEAASAPPPTTPADTVESDAEEVVEAPQASPTGETENTTP